MFVLLVQALGMKVVNIVPVAIAENAKVKMFAALDWSIQRWYEEGRGSDDNIEEGDGDNEVESDIDRPENETYEEEEEDDDDDVWDEEDDVGDLEHDEEEPPVQDDEEEREEEEEEEDDDFHTGAHDPVQELGEHGDEGDEIDIVPHGRSPVGDIQDLGEDILSHGRSPVRGEVGHDGDVDSAIQPDRSLLLPVASFTSGYPPTPGRGFRHDDAIRSSGEVSEQQEEQRPAGTLHTGEEALQDDRQPLRFTSKPTARKKVKASRNGRKSLRPSSTGEASRSVEDSANVEGESIETVPDEDDNVGDLPLIDTQTQSVEPLPAGIERSDEARDELNMSSPVEEVAAAVLEVLGQGRSDVEPSTAVVEEEPAAASPSKDGEVVIRTEVICLDSDDDVPDRRVELDVRVKVKDRVPYRVRGTFADYMTDDSEDEDYGKPGYSRVKLNFIDDPHPVFAGRPQAVGSAKGKESDEKDKVHFAPFVDKYLSDVPEHVRLNLAHMYKSYDYHKMFAYLTTPEFCAAVKVKHILHAASLKKMRKRWTAFEVPPGRHGRDQTAAQAQSVVDSTLEIIDISGVHDSPSREPNVGAAESSSPHAVPRNSPVQVGVAQNPVGSQAQGINLISVL